MSNLIVLANKFENKILIKNSNSQIKNLFIRVSQLEQLLFKLKEELRNLYQQQ